MDNNKEKELNGEELNKVSGGAGWTCSEYYVTGDCFACSCCESECPTGAIRVVGDRAVIDQDACIQCGVCADTCPAGAIETR